MSFFRALSIAGVSAVLLLGGCSDKEEPADNSDPAIPYTDETDGSTINTGDAYGFTDFDLTIVKDGKKIETDYEGVKPSDAEYVNEFQEVKKEGNDAIDSMHPMFMEILIDSSTTKEEVINRILKWYGLDDYDEFELDVKFTDDKTLQIDETK